MTGRRDHDAAGTTAPRAVSAGKTDEISLSPRQIDAKLAFRDLIEAAGGLEAAAGFCRLGKSQLHRCCDKNTLDFAPIDVVHDLEERTASKAGWPHVTRHGARALGLALVAVPCTQHVTSDNVHRHLADAHRESNDVITATLASLQAGKITPAKRRELMRECQEAAEAFMNFHALLEQSAGEP